MNTPYDAGFKSLAEDYPDLLLRLLGLAGPEITCEAVDVLRELHLDPVQIDHAYLLQGGDGNRVVHFEAITRWRTERLPLLALYHFLLRHKYRNSRVLSYVVLMSEASAPKRLPEKLVYEEDDGLRFEIPYQVIRLWEIDPSMVFEPGCEPLLPWAPLLKGGTAEFVRACEAIERLWDTREKTAYKVDVLVSNLATLAALRYDEDTVRRLVKRFERKIMLSKDLFIETWLYKDGVAAGRAEGEAKGKAEGEAKGKVEGKAEGKRSAIKLALNTRFPDLETPAEVDRVDDSDVLDELLRAILKAANSEEARAAVHAALRVN